MTSNTFIGHLASIVIAKIQRNGCLYLSSLTPLSWGSCGFDLGANDTFRIHRSSKPPTRQNMIRVAVMDFLEPAQTAFSMERLACLMKFKGGDVTAVWVWDALVKLTKGTPVCDPGKLTMYQRLLSRKPRTAVAQFFPQAVTDIQMGQIEEQWALQEDKFAKLVSS